MAETWARRGGGGGASARAREGNDGIEPREDCRVGGIVGLVRVDAIPPFEVELVPV